MSDFCWRPSSPLLSYLICMLRRVSNGGEEKKDMEHWRRKGPFGRCHRSIIAISTHNLIKHTPDWSLTCKTGKFAALTAAPLFGQLAGNGSAEKGLRLSAWYLGSRWAIGRNGRAPQRAMELTCREREPEWGVIYALRKCPQRGFPCLRQPN